MIALRRTFLGFLCATGVAWATESASVEIVLEPVRSMVVSAPVDGVLAKVAVDEGDTVSKGDLLVEFVHGDEDLQVERATEVLRKREFDYRGTEKLFTENMTSETETLEKEIELKVAKIELAQAQERRSQRIVQAVSPGTVTMRHRIDGEYVERGTPLLELIDLNQLDARFYVNPEVGLRLQAGDMAWVQVPLTKTVLRCRIVFIDPQVDASSGLMRGRARIDNAEGKLKPGLRGWISFSTTEPTRWP